MAKVVAFDPLAKETEGYSGDDIAKVCRDALIRPIRELDDRGILVQTVKENIPPVSINDFYKSLKVIRPTVSSTLQEKYSRWNEEAGLKMTAR